MKLILEIDIDDATGAEYEHLAPENKLRFKKSVGDLLMKITTGERAKKLRKLLKEMRHESSGIEIDPETLYAMVRNEEY